MSGARDERSALIDSERPTDAIASVIRPAVPRSFYKVSGYVAAAANGWRMKCSHPGSSICALVLPVAAATVVLSGCGSASRTSFVASRCTSANGAVGLKLVLSNIEPIPRLVGRREAVVEVVSSYAGGEMTFPTPHPSKDVCEVSQHRGPDGTSTVVFKAPEKATITFLSSYAHPTNAMDPAMSGRLIVR